MEMGDPLGKPILPTGPEYMEGLAKLGYNVETMNSLLPTYTKAANAATSFMDQAFNQRMAWDKAQADNKETIARANQADSITNYNNQSLSNRIEALRLDNEKTRLGVQYDTDTLPYRESLMQYDAQTKKNELALNQATLDARIAFGKEEGKYSVADATQKTNDLLSAQADRDATITELNQIQPNAPDFDQQIAALHTKHLNAFSNPATQGKILDALANLQKQHNQLASVQLLADNKTEVQRMVKAGYLSPNDNYDPRPGDPGIYQDPKRIQQALVQGHMAEEIDNIQGLDTKITALGAALPAQYRREWDAIKQARDYVLASQNDEGYAKILKGGGNGMLTADGHLSKSVQSGVQDIQNYLTLLAEQQAKAKAATVTQKWGGLTGGTQEQPVTEVQNLPLSALGTQQGAGQGTGGNVQITTQVLDALQPNHPDLKDAVANYYHDATDENYQKIQALVNKYATTDAARGATGGRTGYQSGGEVEAGSAGDPATTAATPFLSGTQFTSGTQFGRGFLGDTPTSTDTVPAMLTPGEFVLNRNATEAIGPANLAQINEIGKNTNEAIGSPMQVLAPLKASPVADTSVAAFAGLSRPTDQIQHPEDAIKDPQLAIAQARPTPQSDTGVQRTLSAGRIPMSNLNNYAYPDGAKDLNGIDRNVWANVMSEEGPEYNMDGKHLSVFGLWQGAPGLEGQAFSTIKAHGSHSLPAFEAVTNTWDKLFLQKTKPQLLKSPGMQELVIADSQHSGGNAPYKIIQQMGGWDKINAMNPADAINQYSALRSHLWGNNQGRVAREREWALKHDSTLSGDQPTMVAGMNAGGMVEGNPLYGPATGLGFQHGGMVPAGGGFESELEGGGGGKVGGGGEGAGFESALDQAGSGGGAEGQRHRRFHPRGAAMGGMGAQPNIPDPMQKKLHKLSQDFIGGLSSLIRSKPELGGEIMRHAKNLIAQTGLSDVRTGGESSPFGGGGAERQQQQPMGMNPAMLAMSGMGGEQGSSSEDAYT